MSFDITNPIDLASLKDEVANDPAGVGYASALGGTQEILDMLNIEGNNPAADQVPIPFDEFPLIDAVDEINNAEYNGLNALKLQKINAMIDAAVRDPGLKFGHTKSMFKQAFGAASVTWGNVKDDRLRHASRAEALFGRDTVITRDEWITARES